MFCYRSNLIYTYQLDTREDDPRLRNEPITHFNRRCWEVLYLIYKSGKRFKLQTKEAGRKPEPMIHDHLPGDLRSQENLVKWRYDSWTRF